MLRLGGQLFVLETVRDEDAAYKEWSAKPVARYDEVHAWAFTEHSLLATVAEAGFGIDDARVLAW